LSLRSAPNMAAGNPTPSRIGRATSHQRGGLSAISRKGGLASGMQNRRILSLAIVVLAIAAAIALRSSAGRSSAGTAPKAGDVTEARVAADAATGNNWLLNGRTFDAKHFSPLQQITDKNIGGLGLAWDLDIDGAMGVVSEPIVAAGVIYLSAPKLTGYAVEGASGKLLWKFDPQVRLDQAINGSY